MKPTKRILQVEQKNSLFKLINLIGSWSASVFSVIFSLSIVREYTKQEDNVLLILVLILFTILFLIFNEYVKVRELRKLFSKKEGSKFIIIATFIISLIMSSTGIYLWTNKGNIMTNETTTFNDQETENIVNKYVSQIDSLRVLSFEGSNEFKRLDQELDFWMNRRAADLKDRAVITENISRVQKELSEYRKDFDQNQKERILLLQNKKDVELKKLEGNVKIQSRRIVRHNFITWIFLIMIVMTELLIIFLAKEFGYFISEEEKFMKKDIVKKFIIQYKILTENLLKKDMINVNDVKSSEFNPKKGNFEYMTKIMSLYVELNINSGKSLKEAQKVLCEYYDHLLKL
jgi:hypothetical protein